MCVCWKRGFNEDQFGGRNSSHRATDIIENGDIPSSLINDCRGFFFLFFLFYPFCPFFLPLFFNLSRAKVSTIYISASGWPGCYAQRRDQKQVLMIRCNTRLGWILTCGVTLENVTNLKKCFRLSASEVFEKRQTMNPYQNLWPCVKIYEISISKVIAYFSSESLNQFFCCVVTEAEPLVQCEYKKIIIKKHAIPCKNQ